jgi:TetR/AcrR family transcriptional regulator, lmrAB and yxaGH operons repressor
MPRKSKALPDGPDSRQRLLETAGRLFRVQGYHGTGLNQIVEESAAPKGSLYHYFPEGKEQLGAEALSMAGRDLRQRWTALLELSPYEALDHLLLESIQELESSDYRDGCPIATVALETTSHSTLLRQTCSQIFQGALSMLQDWLVSKGVDRDQAQAAAVTVFSAYEGALLLSKVQKTTQPLRHVVAQLKVYLSHLTGTKA